MKILEQFIEGKKQDEELCEDGIFVSDDFISIIDGATTKGNMKIDDKTPGRTAMEVIKISLGKAPKDISASDMIKQIFNDLTEFYKQHSIYEQVRDNPSERPTASISIYSCHHKEIWFVGDCQAFVDGVHINNEKNIDIVLSEARAAYIQTEIDSGVSVDSLMQHDTGREFIFPMLKRQGMFQNNKNKSEYSYDVIDGFNVENCEVQVVSAYNAKNIVLASDGYPKVFDTLSVSEEYLEKILKEDPLCFKLYKSTKGIEKGNTSFDDRSYISFALDL